MDNNSQILSKKIDPYAKCISIEEKYVDDDHAQKESLQHSQNWYSWPKLFSPHQWLYTIKKSYLEQRLV